jgi:hypothetical protein
LKGGRGIHSWHGQCHAARQKSSQFFSFGRAARKTVRSQFVLTPASPEFDWV